MQEEIENKTVNLAITTTKLTGRALLRAFQQFRQARHNAKAKGPKVVHGKQTVKQLIGQGQGVTNIEIADTGIRDFEKYARRYGVDFAIKKDKAEGKYIVFFKARDADALTAAFQDYTRATLQKGKRPSVLKKLKELAEIVARTPQRVKEKKQERSL